jgi:hypothetical protein
MGVSFGRCPALTTISAFQRKRTFGNAIRECQKATHLGTSRRQADWVFNLSGCPFADASRRLTCCGQILKSGHLPTPCGGAHQEDLPQWSEAQDRYRLHAPRRPMHSSASPTVRACGTAQGGARAHNQGPPGRHGFQRRSKRPRAFDPVIYRNRNLIERAINKLKRFRRIATRYDRNPQCLLAMLCLAAVLTFWA